MHAGSRNIICAAVTRMRDAYPSLFIGSDEQWRSREEAYFAKLKRFDADTVVEACDSATDWSPAQFPDVGLVVRECRKLTSEREQREREASEAGLRAKAERDNAEAVRGLRSCVIPNDDAGQRRYIDEGGSPFERLAREFEVQSKRNDLDPNKSTPASLHRHRMRRFWGTWAETEQQSNQAPPVGRHQRALAEGKEDSGL
jgi:hypothetical protein